MLCQRKRSAGTEVSEPLFTCKKSKYATPSPTSVVAPARKLETPTKSKQSPVVAPTPKPQTPMKLKQSKTSKQSPVVAPTPKLETPMKCAVAKQQKPVAKVQAKAKAKAMPDPGVIICCGYY